jgi:6,7-dimethyl-8-ribityllumazine synthase
MRETSGVPDGSGKRFAVVASRFNRQICDALVDGALACLREHGVADGDLTVVRVPGAWELPLALDAAAGSRRFDALVAIGVVVRGETPHFDFVCSQATHGLGSVARGAEVPVTFGVLTTDDEAQALARAGEGADNKGYEAALAAVELVWVFRSLSA